MNFDEHVKSYKNQKRKDYYKKWKIRNLAYCKKKNHEYYLKTRNKQLSWQKEYRSLYPEKQIQYRIKTREHRKSYNKKYGENIKIQAYRKIQAKIECIRCGCNDLRFLEINHKNGGRLTKFDHGGRVMYRNIISDKRLTDDLEILCRPCNHIHYLELKYGEKIPLEVKWTPQLELDIRNFAWVRIK